MKIIFLDIDGVLNSYCDHRDLPEYSHYVMPENRTEERGSIEWHAYEFNPSLVERLNKIIEETQAKVVISSSWRQAFSYEEIWDILKYRGFIGEVIGSTPMKFSNYDRGNEVRWWLESSQEDNLKISNFVILDDIDFHGFHQEPWEGEFDLNGHFVHIEDGDGLKDNHVSEAIEILKSKELSICDS